MENNSDSINQEKQTYVLVHGSWHTGDLLEKVAGYLRKYGHEVHTPTIAGHGVEADKSISHEEQVASIASYITENDLKDIVLVGHSYGGTVVAKLAEQMSARVRRFVFWSAFVLDDGDCLMDETPASYQTLFDQLRQASPDRSIMLPFPIWREAFTNDVDMKEAQDTYSLLSSEPESSFYTKLDLKKFYELVGRQQIKCSYLHCTGDIALPPGDYNWYPRFPNKLGLCRVVEFAGASHEALFSDPKRLAEHIVKAGRD
jgi:pimeloyl-ACP methyl ester carboxylesterase